MGLTGLKAGGVVSLSNNIASPAGTHRHVYGVRAVDSSGGEWVYVKASTSAVAGSLVFCAPGADPWQATVPSTGGVGLSTVQGAMLGVQNCTANSTTQDCWIQVSGPGTVLADSTTVGAGVALFISTTQAGAVSVTTTGLRLFGTYCQSSGNSSLIAFNTGSAGFIVNQG